MEISSSNEVLVQDYGQTAPTSGVLDEPLFPRRRPTSWMSGATAMVIPMILAGASITSGVSYHQANVPNQYFSCSVMSPFRRRRPGRSVSLQEARLVALRVFAAAEEGLKKDREEEARIMLKFWDDVE